MLVALGMGPIFGPKMGLEKSLTVLISSGKNLTIYMYIEIFPLTVEIISKLI